MSQRVLVGGRQGLADCLLGIIAAVGLASFVFWRRAEIDDPVALGAYVVAGLIFAVSIGVLLRRRLPTAWATDFGVGLELVDRRGVHEIADAEITAVSLVYDQLHNWQNEAKLNRRRMRLRVVGEHATREFRLESVFPLDAVDPLHDFATRIVARLTAKSAAEVDGGGTLSGDDWQLSAQELRVQTGERSEVWPISGLAAIDIFDKQLCIWRGDDERPAFRRPQSGWNNVILLGVLGNLLTRQADGTANASAAPRGAAAGLGRVLYERRQSKSAIALYYLITAAFVVGLLATTVTWLTDRDGDAAGYATGIGCLALLSVVGAVASRFSAREVFRCHERGIFQCKHLREHRLEFGEIAAFTFRAVRRYYNDNYAGTTYDLLFEPEGNRGLPTIHYHKVMQRDDDELFNAIRDHVAGVIGGRMADEARQGNPVAWTATIRFDDGRLYYHSHGDPGEERSMPLDDVRRYRFEGGVLYLIARDAEVAFLAIRTDERNCFPGFRCLELLSAATQVR